MLWKRANYETRFSKPMSFEHSLEMQRRCFNLPGSLWSYGDKQSCSEIIAQQGFGLRFWAAIPGFFYQKKYREHLSH